MSSITGRSLAQRVRKVVLDMAEKKVLAWLPEEDQKNEEFVEALKWSQVAEWTDAEWQSITFPLGAKLGIEFDYSQTPIVTWTKIQLRAEARMRVAVGRLCAATMELEGAILGGDWSREKEAVSVQKKLRDVLGNMVRDEVRTIVCKTRRRGRSIPHVVKQAVLGFVEKEFCGDVRGEGGWKAAYDRFVVSPECAHGVRQYVESPQSMRRIAEAARTEERRRQKK
jgi:hypothetical protein